MKSREHLRLEEARGGRVPWKKWGPYLSERQWGTVREDYSADGSAWESFPHDQARSRAYRWGEDGLAGFSDDRQRLCFAVALWNGKDAILKERLFGLTNGEGNHGEDVKEYYFYLDSTPTHSYMRYLYKYCQQPYPYDRLVEQNRRRTRNDFEYELLDSGVFAEDRYFDVYVEYAKVSAEDVLIEISVCNRGPEPATLHVLPTLWFRNTWRWQPGDVVRPSLIAVSEAPPASCIGATHAELGSRFLWCDGAPRLLFTENETNAQRLYRTPNVTPWVKDGINDAIVHGNAAAVNQTQVGTKAAAYYQVTVDPGATATLRLRLCEAEAAVTGAPFEGFDGILDARRREADEFYREITPVGASADEALVMRQALAGMLWSKQHYYFDADIWLSQHSAHPLRNDSRHARNRDWFHMLNNHVISMPDKWEYPWYAAWDLAFHAIALAPVDIDFAKEQLDLMLRETYLHPNGQLPAYEWNFSDVNPPVHAWATLFLHRTEQALRGESDLRFLKRAYWKLLLNFTWWVNRKDRFGKNVFEGGFLGLDNIGVFDRSAPLPTGGTLEQADGTAWMALFCQNMAELGVELATEDEIYVEMVYKFIEHFLLIASAMSRQGHDGMWDEEDGFYYDVLRLPDGTARRLKVRSIVGLLPMCATTTIEPWQRALIPEAMERLAARIRRTPELAGVIHATGPESRGVGDRGIIALLDQTRLRRILSKLLDENEFLGSCGIRALSRYHERHPYTFNVGNDEYRVEYQPAESNSGMFGGNSNWRGPIWLPVNALIIRALLQFYLYYGDSFKVECPTGSGRMMSLFEVSRELSRRLISIFVRDGQGRRPVYGGTEKFQSDPHWRDLILFYEYFHGDNGAGLGASHQTGWTGVIAKIIELYYRLDGATLLAAGREATFARHGREPQHVSPSTASDARPAPSKRDKSAIGSKANG